MKKAFVSVLTIALVITLLPLFSTNVSAADVTINGTILDGDGNPLGGVDITAEHETGTTNTATSNATTGKFTLTLTKTGTFTFNFEKAGFGLKSSYDTLNSDRELTISGTEGSIKMDIMMGPAYGGIVGHVRNVNGDGLGDAIVRVMSGNKVINHTTTDGNGLYSFDEGDTSDRILIGTYSVHVTRSDHVEQTTHDIEVKEGENKTVDFALESKENTYLLGMDLPHSLMVGGFILGMLMIIGVSVYRKRLGERLLGTDEDTDADEEQPETPQRDRWGRLI